MIGIGSDHGGFALKNEIIVYLEEQGLEYADVGTLTGEACDYPDIAKSVCEGVQRGLYDRGILVCGTGQGVTMSANRYDGIRCALCNDVFSAKMSRAHNDSNMLAMGGRVIGAGPALLVVEAWLNTPFEGGRHKLRIEKMMKMGGK